MSENAHLRMRVDPQGGGLQSLRTVLHDRPVLWEGGDSALFPMVPLANRVAGNCFPFRGRDISLPQSPADADFFLHGDGWLKRWTVVEHTATACLMTLRSQHPCGFDYQAWLHYQLCDNVLRAQLSLTHLGDTPMLYGLGFHPWFAFDEAGLVQFHASGYWPEGERHLPRSWQQCIPADKDFSRARHSGDVWLNVGYSGWNGRAKVFTNGMSVMLSSSTPWLMVYRTPGQSFLCLEPQSHPVNAHHMDGQPGLVALGAGDSTGIAMDIVVDVADAAC